MKPSPRLRRPSQWPFWLLIAAWVCANTPAIAVCALLTWLGEARHFSHQQRLMTDVAYVLTGNQPPGLGVMAAVKDLPLPKPLPATTAGAELKKIVLMVERSVEMQTPYALEKDFVIQAITWHEARRAAPPHEPPRVKVMA